MNPRVYMNQEARYQQSSCVSDTHENPLFTARSHVKHVCLIVFNVGLIQLLQDGLFLDLPCNQEKKDPHKYQLRDWGWGSLRNALTQCVQGSGLDPQHRINSAKLPQSQPSGGRSREDQKFKVILSTERVPGQPALDLVSKSKQASK